MSKELIKEINLLYKETQYPFPSEDIYYLQENHGADDDLYFNFDIYFMSLAGYSSWGYGILKWKGEWLDKAKDFLSCSFFEQYPQYQKLKMFIDDRNTPELY